MSETTRVTVQSRTEPQPLRPTCPGCGRSARQGWVYVGTTLSPDDWTPGRWECFTPGCQYGPPAEVTP